MLTSLYFLFECIAFVSSAINYPYLRQSFYKYLFPYLGFIVFYEFGSLYNWFTVNHSNAWITNITITVFFVFYSWLLNSILKKFKRTTSANNLVVLFILVFTVLTVFIQGFWILDTYAILAQFMWLVILTCTFFYRLINEPTDQRIDIIKLPDFWINTGMLFFCLAEFLFYASYAYMAMRKNYDYYIFFVVISNVANLILYSSLAISFVCFRTMKKSS